MSCKHLKELYEMCERHNLKLSSTDLIRIVCPQCGVEEQCPSLLCRDYDTLPKKDEEAQEA
jgi:hypothetical protein